MNHDLGQLRVFLSRALPWPKPDDDYYINVHWLRWDEKTKKKYWTGRACKTVDEADRAIAWAQTLPDTRDVYVCMSAQRDCEPKTSLKGHQYLVPIRNQANAVVLKDLYLDIDLKDGEKGYADLKEAVTALGEFIKTVGLPKPTMMVGSGGGVHAHWELDRALPPAEWQRLADALAEATRQKGLRCDTQVTVDSARILRPPLTFNWKTEPPRPTKLLGKVVDGSYSVEVIEAALAPFVIETKRSHILGSIGEISPKFGVNENDISAGISVAKVVDLNELIDECAWVRSSLENGGINNNNALRRQVYLLCSFTENPTVSAWEMVKNRDTLTPGEFDMEMDRILREKETHDFGWPSCKAIRNAGCMDCAGCPHFVEGKSPASFRKVLARIGEANGFPLPPKFFLNKDGAVCITKQDDMGGRELIPLINYPISEPWLQEDPWIIHFTAVTHSNKKKKIEIPFGQATAPDTVVKALAERGVMVDPNNGKLVRDFFMSWVNLLQKRKNSVMESAPYGWNTNDGEVDGFCFGGEVWTVDGSRPAPEKDLELRRQYKPSGSVEHWETAAKLVVGKGRPDLEIIVASAFAGPIVKATGWYGSFLNTYSQESGIGKTTAMKVAQAVWGNPVTAMQGLDDTLVSASSKIGQIRSLPLYWDEIKGEENVNKFTKLAFQLTSGKDKSRAKRDGSLAAVNKWQTMLVSATNDSILDYVAAHAGQTTAGLYRVFEFCVLPKKKVFGDVDTGEAQRILSKLDDNYGNVGLEYAKWLGANYRRIDLEVGEYMKTLEKTWGFKQDERFWLCGITCVIMGARYANEIGYGGFDIAAMEAFLKQALEQMREHLKETHVDLTNSVNVMNLFTQFLKAMNRHTIWTNRIPKSAGRPKPGEFRVLKDATRLDGIHIHIGKEDKLLRISSAALSEWCGDRGISRHIFMRELKNRFGAKDRVARLASGTDYVQNQEHIIEFLAAGTPLATFIDESTEDEADDAA